MMSLKLRHRFTMIMIMIMIMTQRTKIQQTSTTAIVPFTSLPTSLVMD